MLELIFYIEVLLFNLFIFDKCCERKYSYKILIPALVIFTCVFIVSGYWMRQQLFPEVFGKGTFVIIGFFYILPLYLLYREKVFRIFVVMCMAWSYTFSIMAISIQVGKLFLEENYMRNALLLETLLFLLTAWPFFQFILPKFVFILQNIYRIASDLSKYLALNGTLYFFLLMLTNNIFTGGEGSFYKVIMILLLTAFDFVFYITIYHMVYGAARVRKMEEEAGFDALTGAANRVRLFSDLEELIREEKIFSILFMDLDHFKQINDKFGHIIGDQYLKHFVKVSSLLFEGRGTLYRFGGDEFVLLYPGQVAKQEIDRLRRCESWEEGAPCPFYQVSVGFLHCRPPHKSAERILQQVDREMYRQKEKRYAKKLL